jgi:hypothetical protein
MTRNAVAAPAHRHQQMVCTRELDAADHVGCSGAAGDQGRASVDIGVPDLAGLGIACIVGRDEWAAQALLEGFDGGCRERDLPAREPRRS